MGGVELEQSECEKYLGDLISDKGCVDSITKTIKKRIESNYHKCEEILKIADNGLLAGMGNSKTAITLFEVQVVPAVLFNCESWIGLNKNHINTLQSFQDAFICKLLHLSRMGTPKSLVSMINLAKLSSNCNCTVLAILSLFPESIKTTLKKRTCISNKCQTR